MPVARFQLEDGRIARFEVPEGTTPEQAQSLMSGYFAQPKAAAAPEKAPDPTEGMSRTELALAGIGKAFADTGRGIGQLMGLVSNKDVEESRKRDAALMGNGWGAAGNIAGNVALAAPAAMVPGAATIPGALAIGAVQGALQPSTSVSERLLNNGVGAVSSAAVPAAITGARVAKSFIEPFYESGRAQILGRALNEAAGGQGAQVLQNLRGYQSGVPGVIPTAAEAAQNPGISALQRTATASDPVAMNALDARMVQNNLARIDALKAIAGDATQAKEARQAAAEAWYQMANGKTITLTPELESLLKRPLMQSAVGEAKNLAANEGRAFSLKPKQPGPYQSGLMGAPTEIPGSMSGQDAHTVKRAIDDVIEGLAGQQGLARNSRRAASGTQAEFLGEIEKQVPEYGMARSLYQQMSRPVNQAEAVDLMLQRATNNINGNMTPAAFNRAVSDRTVQSALGRKGVTLEDVFDKPQLEQIAALKDSLLRLNNANNAGRGVGSDTVQKLAFNNMLSQAGVPQAIRTFPAAGIAGNVLQRVGQVAYKDANDVLRQRLAQSLLNPGATADLLEAGLLNPRLAKAIENANRIGAVTTPSIGLGLLADRGE